MRDLAAQIDHADARLVAQILQRVMLGEPLDVSPGPELSEAAAAVDRLVTASTTPGFDGGRELALWAIRATIEQLRNAVTATQFTALAAESARKAT